ncbi:hypothetical protein D3C71_1871830 [compost metagenome]
MQQQAQFALEADAVFAVPAIEEQAQIAQVDHQGHGFADIADAQVELDRSAGQVGQQDSQRATAHAHGVGKRQGCAEYHHAEHDQQVRGDYLGVQLDARQHQAPGQRLKEDGQPV